MKIKKDHGNGLDVLVRGEELLPVRLTDHELVTLAKECARLSRDTVDIEQQRKDANASFKTTIQANETRMADLARRIERGEELQRVAVEWRYAYADGEKELWRVDGDKPEFVRVDRIADHERQPPLPLAGPTVTGSA